MSRTERNHGRSHWDQAAERKRLNGGGNGRADTEHTAGTDANHSTSPDGDAGDGLTTRLKRMYRERVEEPLPETFRSLVRRLRSANDTPSD
jgi:hypothetical protein